MPTPSPYAQAVIDECLRQGAAIAAHEDAPCGVYSSSILKSLGLTFQGLVMAVSLAFAAVTFAANSGSTKSQFLVKMRSRMNLPFFLGAAIAYGSLIFIYQGPYVPTVILAYWMREIGFAIHYGAVFLKIISELRYRPSRFGRISNLSTTSANHHQNVTANSEGAALVSVNNNNISSGGPNSNSNNNARKNNTKSPAPSTTSNTTQQAWARATNKLNQTRLNKNSIINFVYILLVPVVALSVWSASFASFPPPSARRALCFAQPWSFVIEACELTFIAFTLALTVRTVYKGGQSPRHFGPMFEIKMYKLLAVILANELVFSTVFYGLRHAAAMTASSDMMALAHMLRDNMTLTLNLMAVFIFKVAIRGGQMGSRTDMSSAKASANNNRVASSVLSGGHNSVRAPSTAVTLSVGGIGYTMNEENGSLLPNSHAGPDDVDVEIDATAQCIEIAELKRELRRVQMQAEYYRVKAMRKDNPHLSSGSTGNKTQSPGRNNSSASKRPPSVEPGKHSLTERSPNNDTNNRPTSILTVSRSTPPASSPITNRNNNVRSGAGVGQSEAAPSLQSPNNETKGKINNNNASVLSRVPAAPPVQPTNNNNSTTNSLKPPTSH